MKYYSLLIFLHIYLNTYYSAHNFYKYKIDAFDYKSINSTFCSLEFKEYYDHDFDNCLNFYTLSLIIFIRNYITNLFFIST